MSTKATPEATIKRIPRWASQVNGVSCQTLDRSDGGHPDGHQTEANAEACQATRLRARTKASDGNTQDPTPEIIRFDGFYYVQTSAGQPCQHYIPGDNHSTGHKDRGNAEKCMGVMATSKATSQPEGMPTNPPAADGPGRESDPLVKLAVERYAEDRAIEWLEGRGWVCQRIGAWAPFDLRCTKGDQELHAEVKGTRGPGKVVKLTRNEVLHNQKLCRWETKCDAQALFVVSGVTVTDLTPSGGDLTASGGEMGYACPWKITGTVLCDGDLDPTEFDYTVPELTTAAF